MEDEAGEVVDGVTLDPVPTMGAQNVAREHPAESHVSTIACSTTSCKVYPISARKRVSMPWTGGMKEAFSYHLEKG